MQSRISRGSVLPSFPSYRVVGSDVCACSALFSAMTCQRFLHRFKCKIVCFWAIVIHNCLGFHLMCVGEARVRSKTSISHPHNFGI